MSEEVFKAYQESKKSLADSFMSAREKIGMARGGDEHANFAFLITCLDFFYSREHSLSELLEKISDGNKDLSICDLINVDSNGNVDIFDVKETAKQVATSRLNEAKLSLRDFFLKKPSDLSPCNPILRKQLEILHKVGARRVNLYFVRSESSVSDLDRAFSRELHDGLSTVKVITPRDLVKMRTQNAYVSSIALNPEGEVIREMIKEEKGLCNYVIFKLPLEQLMECHALHLEKSIDLFASNVRNPKRSAKFAFGLKENLVNRPDRFHLYHNGITMTASKIAHDGSLYVLHEPQIVNGAQTLGNIASLVSTGSIGSDLNHASVMCKVILANDNEVDDICEASNTQRKVTAVELRSNDSFQKELTLLINALGKGKFCYIRKPKQGRVPSGAISLDKLYQWAHSAIRHRPYESKNMKERLFSKSKSDYREISNEIANNTRHIKRLCEIGLFVNGVIARIPDKEIRGLARDMNNHIIAYMYVKNLDTTLPMFESAFDLFETDYRLALSKKPLLDSGAYFKSDVSFIKKHYA